MLASAHFVLLWAVAGGALVTIAGAGAAGVPGLPPGPPAMRRWQLGFAAAVARQGGASGVGTN